MPEAFIFYFGPGPVYSHWFKSDFSVDNQRFCCVGQYLMYQKAMLFGATEIAKKIMNSTDPARHRRLGKQVAGFNKTLWQQHCRQFAFDANYAKFTQNPELMETLLQTAGKSFAEVSPYDRIWGIGLSIENPKIYDRSQWRGKNWAGEALELVRARLKGI